MTVALTPDGYRYLSPNPPRPFTLRPLIPWLCRKTPWRWQAATIAGIAATLAGTWLLVGGWQGIAAALLVAALPSTRFNATHPILVDAPALGLATLAAGMYVHGWLIPALVLTALAAASKETAPIFAAAFAWTPLLLAAMVIPAAVYLIRKPGPDLLDNGDQEWILKHPIRASRMFHKRYLLDLHPNLVTPWGANVVALGAPSLQLFTVLALAYAQLCVATDTVRLYQWAAPTVAIAATTAVEPQWWPLLVILTAFNPLRGDGI